MLCILYNLFFFFFEMKGVNRISRYNLKFQNEIYVSFVKIGAISSKIPSIRCKYWWYYLLPLNQFSITTISSSADVNETLALLVTFCMIKFCLHLSSSEPVYPWFGERYFFKIRPSYVFLDWVKV